MGFRTSIERPVGWFCLEVWRRGQLVDQMNEPNAICVGYRDMAAAAISGAAGGQVTQIGFGSGTGAAAYGNTSLTGAFRKPLDGATLTGGASGSVVFQFSLGSSDANGVNIGEFGLLTASGVLVARKVRIAPPIAKDLTISLSGTWTISFVGA